MRTFVAIDIPNDIRRRIQELMDVLKPASSGIRWTRADGFHLTLKFIGEIAAEQVEAVKINLASVPTSSPIRIAIGGAGYFPNERSPRVIWLGIEGGQELAALAAQMEESLYRLGIAKEKRLFSPHLTLGRLRSPHKITAIQELLRRREPLEFGSFVAQEFSLYESRLSPEGSQYLKIARFPIAGYEP